MIASRLMKPTLFVTLLLMALLIAGCGTNIYPTSTHQGRLLDNHGNPVPDGTYPAEYNLFHSSTGGTAVYTQAANLITRDGYFDSAFGATDVDPKIFAQRTWLEITVNGETLTPRQFLRGAPYASSLVAGAAVIGNVPMDYTYGSHDRVGSALFVVNSDSTAEGGSGLTAIVRGSTGIVDRLNVAAVRGIAEDADGNNATGPYAGIFVADDFRGLYASKGDSSDYAAWFAGDIRVSGCTGCTTTLISRNVGTDTIASGDFVAAAGVEIDEEYGMPVMLVRKVGAEDAVVGVAQSAMMRGEYDANTLAEFGYDSRAGSAVTGDFVSVVMEGLVQARLPDATQFAIGDYVVSDTDRLHASGNSASSIAQVMSEVDENGLTWILLNR